MIRRFALSVCALAALSLAQAAHAQEQQRGKVGVGIAAGFDTPDAGAAGPYRRAYILVPIQLAQTLKLEPMIGFNSYNHAGADGLDVTLGTGVLWVFTRAGPVDAYAGGRVALDVVSANRGAGTETGLDFRLAGAIGGEWFAASHFSLGIEADVGFYTTSRANPSLSSSNGVFTAGYLIGRVYF